MKTAKDTTDTTPEDTTNFTGQSDMIYHITTEFGREDLNALVAKLNEVIDKINK